MPFVHKGTRLIQGRDFSQRHLCPATPDPLKLLRSLRRPILIFYDIVNEVRCRSSLPSRREKNDEPKGCSSAAFMLLQWRLSITNWPVLFLSPVVPFDSDVIADCKVTSSTYKATSASTTFTETGERRAGKSVGNVISINPGQLGRDCATAYATVSFSHR